MKKRLFIIVNHDWFFLSHRKAVALGAIEAGFDVTLVAKATTRREEIEALGIRFIDFKVNPTGKNPVQELQTLWFLARLFRCERPDIVHNVGLKNMLWGGIAARWAGVPVSINAVSGLGVMFSAPKLGLTARLMTAGFRYAMARPQAYAIFQNEEDKALFSRLGIVRPEQCEHTNGSGVDLEEYAYAPEPEGGRIVVLFTARMVREKGLATLVDAANRLREEYEMRVEFRLCGGLSENPTAYRREEVEAMCDGMYIRWMGLRHDIPEMLRQSHIVAFPSYYREGVPKSLIEACAVGRPIVTCDSVGCRDCVEEGENGFLISPRDSAALADRLRRLFEDAELRKQMGLASRRKAERDFDVRDVVEAHLRLYRQIQY